MKAPARPQVGPLDQVNHRTDRVAHPAGRHQRQAAARHGAEVLQIRRNGPAQRQIQARAQPAGGVQPEHFQQNARQRRPPDGRQEQRQHLPVHIPQAERGVTARNQHIDHGVVQLAQAQKGFGAAQGVVVQAAGRIQRHQRHTEHQRPGQHHAPGPRLMGPKQQGQNAQHPRRGTPKVGVAAQRLPPMFEICVHCIRLPAAA